MSDQELDGKLDALETKLLEMRRYRHAGDDQALVRVLGDVERAAESALYRLHVLVDWRPWKGRA